VAQFYGYQHIQVIYLFMYVTLSQLSPAFMGCYNYHATHEWPYHSFPELGLLGCQALSVLDAGSESQHAFPVDSLRSLVAAERLGQPSPLQETGQKW